LLGQTFFLIFTKWGFKLSSFRKLHHKWQAFAIIVESVCGGKKIWFLLLFIYFYQKTFDLISYDLLSHQLHHLHLVMQILVFAIFAGFYQFLPLSRQNRRPSLEF